MRGERGEPRTSYGLVPEHLREALLTGNRDTAMKAISEIYGWSAVTGIPVTKETRQLLLKDLKKSQRKPDRIVRLALTGKEAEFPENVVVGVKRFIQRRQRIA